jgi:lysine/ornithine N-monooxygenase
MVLKTLSTLPVDDVFESSNENQYGIMVPSEEHQFEYILMKSQFSKTAFPDKYQKYFSAMDPAIRSSIFRYMQLKYNFVFNVIEDLYTPKNSLIFFLFYKKSKRLGPLVEKASTEKNNRASANFI